MNFQPHSEQEIQAMGLIEEGVYPFEVIEAADKKSKSGNDMIELKLKLWDNLGRERQCFDYLLEAMAFKLRHFCEAVGLLDKYEAGSLQASDCLSRSGKLELVIQEGKQNPNGGTYPNKNSVKDYIKPEGGAVSKPSEEAKDDGFSDDIPF